MIVPRSNICQRELFVVAPEGTAYQRMPGSQSVKVATFRRPQDCAVHNEHRVTISALWRTYEYRSTRELCLRSFQRNMWLKENKAIFFTQPFPRRRTEYQVLRSLKISTKGKRTCRKHTRREGIKTPLWDPKQVSCMSLYKHSHAKSGHRYGV